VLEEARSGTTSVMAMPVKAAAAEHSLAVLTSLYEPHVPPVVDHASVGAKASIEFTRR